MPFVSRRYRKKSYPKKKRVAGGMRRRMRIARSPRVYSQTFTEVFTTGSVPTNAGGTFTTEFSQIPQCGQYATLYKQFCIKKLEVTLMPRLNSFDPNTAGGTGLSFWAPRLAYSVDDTPNVISPTSELDVLTDNGVKVVSMTRPIKLTCYPKPSIGSINIDSSTVATRQRKMVWFNQRNAEVGNDGWSVPHGSIRYWISANPILGDYQFDVYYRVTFSCRDPA